MSFFNTIANAFTNPTEAFSELTKPLSDVTNFVPLPNPFSTNNIPKTQNTASTTSNNNVNNTTDYVQGVPLNLSGPTTPIRWSQPDAGAFVNTETIPVVPINNAAPQNTQSTSKPTINTNDLFPFGTSLDNNTTWNPTTNSNSTQNQTQTTNHPYNDTMSVTNPTPQLTTINENTGFIVLTGIAVLLFIMR